jgi:hypothetical protein
MAAGKLPAPHQLTQPMIDEMFGSQVALIVCGRSDSLTEDPTEKEEWVVRKQRYIDHVATAEPDVIFVSCPDKRHNARSLWTNIQRDGPSTVDRFNATGPQTAWCYSDLLRVFMERNAPDDLLIPLQDVVRELVGVLSES